MAWCIHDCSTPGGPPAEASISLPGPKRGALGALALALGLATGAAACADATAGPRPVTHDGTATTSACLLAPQGYARLDLRAPRSYERADAKFHLGQAFAAEGDHAAALEAYDAALEADPTHGFAHLGKADSLWATEDDYKRVREHLANAISLLPESPRAHLRFAEVSAGMGDMETAVRHWRCALERRPDLVEARAALGHHLFEEGQLEEAERELRTVVEAEPDQIRYRALLAEALEARGNPLEAARELERAARQTERSAVLWRRAAALYEAGGDTRAAARLRSRADALDPPAEQRHLRPLPPAREPGSRAKKKR